MIHAIATYLPPMTWGSAASALAVFTSLVALDFFWARYTFAMTGGRALRAGAWAAVLILASGIATIGYAAAPWLLGPAMCGAFLGTWLAVRAERKRMDTANAAPGETVDVFLTTCTRPDHACGRPGAGPCNGLPARCTGACRSRGCNCRFVDVVIPRAAARCTGACMSRGCNCYSREPACGHASTGACCSACLDLWRQHGGHQ